MWIMILMTSWFEGGGYNSADVRTSTEVVSIEFSSKDRCVNAVKFVKKQPKVYNAFCVQK